MRTTSRQMMCLFIIFMTACSNIYATTSDLCNATLSTKEYRDLSDNKRIKIEEPQLAIVNITGIESMPTGKEDNYQAWFEYSDENNIYFKKKVIINAQGASSLKYPKKNLSIKFCEDDWKGDSTAQISIGNWVKQDAFHFKASWIDSFRGGLAVTTSYRLYEDMVADEPHILERAGLKDYNEKALCHPDGFPCIIYLNGDFYGIYAWQLKNHRKNMGMDKDNSQHVWFQLQTYPSSFTISSVFMDYIEIKNPKVSTEESSSYIQNLVLYHRQLSTLSRTISNAEMQKEIAKRYDVQSVIDFIIHGLVTANIDGFGKNANFFTYDGKRWFVTPYDLDETFGNSWIATFQFPPQWPFVSYDYRMKAAMDIPPFNWVSKYFWDDIKERYADLRHQHTISTENILRHLKDWNARAGMYYEQEYTRWSECPSNGTTIINDCWEFIEDWSDYSATQAFDAAKEYQVGEKCVYNYRIFKAKRKSKGETPVTQMGYTDDETRVAQWLSARIQLLDEYLNFTDSADDIKDIVDDTNSVTTSKIWHNGTFMIKRGNRYYRLDGVTYSH